MEYAHRNEGTVSLVQQLPKLPVHSSPASPFDDLATEIMQKIFISACPYVNCPGLQTMDPEDHLPLPPHVADPVILSMVCRRWRDIALTYHAIWADLVINAAVISSDGDPDGRGFVQLRDRLLKSGAHPLKVRVDYDPEVYYCYVRKPMDYIVAEILDIVISHSERWHTIEFNFPLPGDDFIEKVNALKGRLPLLKHLHLPRFSEVPSTSEKCTVFLSAPWLKHVCLRDIRITRTVEIPWTQISEVTFNHREFRNTQAILEIMARVAASIKVLTFSSTTNSLDGPFPEEQKPITLPHLRKLYFPDRYKGILRSLLCPSLEWLEIGYIAAEIPKFLDRSSCALKHIHLDNIEDLRNESISIFNHSSLSTLTSLSFRQLSDPILDLLIYESGHSFPLLETLYMDLSAGTQSSLDSQVEALQNIVESRTRPMSLNDTQRTPAPESFTVDACVIHTQDNLDTSPSSLKTCLFAFHLAVRKDGKGGWDTASVEELRSLCISRRVLVKVDTVSYWKDWPWDRAPRAWEFRGFNS